MKVITRFAPSPTGILHTGSARTALFNYLFSKKNNGKFLLRIEDTDVARSTKEFETSIIKDLEWLGLQWDGDIVYQLQRGKRHTEVANELVNTGHAYFCYCSVEEIDTFRKANPYGKFQSPWRDKTPDEAMATTSKVIRLKAPKTGKTVIHDLIQGTIEVENQELDDMILLRSDGTPTYMLAVVVDDHDMDITHIIRGDDHLTNAFRQKQIYEAMGWQTPHFAHIPLIHDKNGKKLSKREGALGIDAYIELGYLKEAVCNHLLRLGWSHGDDEIISMARAEEIFNLESVGKSPARFDIDKLNFINAHYLRLYDDKQLYDLIKARLPNHDNAEMILKAMPLIKPRAHTLVELAELASLFIAKRSSLDAKSQEVLGQGAQSLALSLCAQVFAQINDWNDQNIKASCETWASQNNLKLPQIMQALRATVLGTFNSPAIFEVIAVLGRDETIKRINLQS
jgi:glutamyl-tRNA synthetase